MGTVGNAGLVSKSGDCQERSREERKGQNKLGTRGKNERLVDFMARLRSRRREHSHGSRGRVPKSKQTVESVSSEVFGVELPGRFESTDELTKTG